MQPHMRASDADRHRVAQILAEHTTAGRLSLDEYTARLDAANRAVTHADLAPLTADLPAAAEPPPARRLPTALVVAGIVLAVLLLAALVAGIAGSMHMGSMMGHCG